MVHGTRLRYYNINQESHNWTRYTYFSDCKMKDKNIIVCIVGSSGSGKTFLAQHLEKTQEIPVVISYTTRPMREGEVDGVEHWFVGPDRVKQAKKDKDILAYTKFGDH